jgi:hypothetical protein
VRDRLCRNEPLPLRESGLPDALCGLIRGLLVKAPEGRISSAAEVAAILRGEAPLPCPQPGGQILAPADGQALSTAFPARGELENIPRGWHAWLVVERGNRCWPKEPAIGIEDGDEEGLDLEVGEGPRDMDGERVKGRVSPRRRLPARPAPGRALLVRV